MAIETRCNQCGTILTVADEHAGKLARCPSCRTQFTVPDRSDETALDAVCHFCGESLRPSQLADEKFTTCDECQASIVENQQEIEAEAATAQRTRKLLITTALLVGGGLAILLLADLVHDYLGARGLAP